MVTASAARLSWRSRVSDLKTDMKVGLIPTLAAYLTKDGREARRTLEEFRNVHAGGRCVIMGNGPSLNDTDMALLSGEIVFGLNRIYLMYDRLPFRPAYHVVVNGLVVDQSVEELRTSTVPLFTTGTNRAPLRGRADAYFLSQWMRPKFHRNVALGIWEGMTVTFVAMQIAYYMGFDEVILIGVDHNFTTKGTAHKTVTSEGDDPNHFDPNYFGKGFKWQLPDLENSEHAYRMARDAFERDGRRIVDSTVGGKLEVFEKVPLDRVLRGEH
jgi:hypothetical protein